jgi:hypothetical protein
MLFTYWVILRSQIVFALEDQVISKEPERYACGRIGVTAYRRSAPAMTQPKISQTYFSDFVDLSSPAGPSEPLARAPRTDAHTPSRRYGSLGSWILAPY